MSIAETHFFQAKPDVVDCDIGGERALLHLDSNTYFTLNPTASEVWLALTEPRNIDALVGVVMEKFDVPEDLCRADIETLVSQMVEANIIEKAQKAGAA